MIALDLLKMSQNSVKDNNMGYMKRKWDEVMIITDFERLN
jgi:hypothetical protein